MDLNGIHNEVIITQYSSSLNGKILLCKDKAEAHNRR